MPVPELLPELPVGTIPGGQAGDGVALRALLELVEDELPGTQLLLLAPLSEEPEPAVLAPGAFVDGEVLRPEPDELPVPKLEPPGGGAPPV